MTSQPENALQLPINQALDDSRNQALRAKLLPALWGLSGAALRQSDPYIDYYNSHMIFIEAYNLHIRTHQDLLDLINSIRSKSSVPLDVLLKELNAEFPQLGPAMRAVEIAVRIWLMISTEGWETTQSLEDFLNHCFPTSKQLPHADPFPLAFNALNLQRIGAFQIVWTECSQDHLSLTITETQKVLNLFHLSAFLQSNKHGLDGTIFPPNLLQETAQTLSLLIPASNIDCMRWVRKAQRQDEIDLEAGLFPPTSRDISNYPYWGRQLQILRDEHDRTEPTTLKQWILDRRRPNQRYTFLIAVVALALALFFGLVQSVTGVLQVVYSARE
ncbi:hypothetical protein P170DRAFT_509749 [Aspergillus steynii IBT 23096]|uniref:Uncharacterized protein n=1 Tax=Aspergillus steynii IBT 23096 TaxID=1392250 RepID=A0A2I2G8C7_9EURO|nr:uncharacterized protein P170DRAFT_509749 [Aspergillus steynii IBT 23096]PLB49136.1 hypothetical protein P170DRAFT_509749 [Aspergillus steynii IBT 23096]